MRRFVAICVVLLLMTCFLSACAPSEKVNVDFKIGVVYSGNAEDPITATFMSEIDDLIKTYEIKEENVIEKVCKADEFESFNVIWDLVEQKCELVIACDPMLEDYMVQAAMENPKVQFCTYRGTQAKDSPLENVHTFSVGEFESKYLAGVVAGLKFNELLDNGEITTTETKIGYIGGLQSTQAISNYSALYLGAKSVCPSVTMDVQYSGKEESAVLEENSARALIANGAKIIAQESLLNGAAKVCEEYNIYYIGNTLTDSSIAPDFSLTSTSCNWSSYFEYAVKCVAKKEMIDKTWCKGVGDDAVCITDINEKALDKDSYENAKTKTEDIIKSLSDGLLHVFDTSTWTVDGKKIESTVSDELSGEYMGVEYISDKGYFMEGEINSSPAFAFKIDGIAVLNA